MSRLRTHGRTNMWKYSAWAESAISVSTSIDALRIITTRWEWRGCCVRQYQTLSGLSIKDSVSRLSACYVRVSAPPHHHDLPPPTAIPHIQTFNFDPNALLEYMSSVQSHTGFTFWIADSASSRILLYFPSGVCRRVSMCHRRDISDFLHCVLDRTNQIFSESTWYHYPLTNLPLTHHPAWPTRPKKTQTWTFLHFMTFYTKQTINFLKACDTYYPLWP